MSLGPRPSRTLEVTQNSVLGDPHSVQCHRAGCRGQEHDGGEGQTLMGVKVVGK